MRVKCSVPALFHFWSTLCDTAQPVLCGTKSCLIWQTSSLKQIRKQATCCSISGGMVMGWTSEQSWPVGNGSRSFARKSLVKEISCTAPTDMRLKNTCRKRIKCYTSVDPGDPCRPGSTWLNNIGPTMVFGMIAGQHAAKIE